MNDLLFGKFKLSNYANQAIVTDANIAKLYNITGDNVFLLPQGEEAKSFKYVEALCRWFLSRNVTTHDVVVAVGGGSIGDTVGFATCIYKRGTYILHVPTTLIAMIDSSIGGKTAINLDGVKNAVGMYHLGDTLIDMDFLKTLPDEQMLSGEGEILKYRMLTKDVDEEFIGGKPKLKDVVDACVYYKREICERDMADTGIRRTLNFGHTIGHALELTYGIPHGVAVANGIFYETLVAAKTKKCTSRYAKYWMSEVADKFPIYPLTEHILTLTLNDKKNRDSMHACLILPPKFACVDFTLDELKELLLND